MVAGAWGLLGSFIVEALEFAAALRRAKSPPWKRPGEPRLAAYLLSVVLRLAAGAGLAAAAGADNQIAGPFAATVLGITTPLVVEKLLRQIGTAPIEPAVPLTRASAAPARPTAQGTEPSDAR